MPGENSGLSPEAAPVGDHDHHSRVRDKERFADKPKAQGVPADEGMDRADAADRLEESPEEVANRRDVPDTPENSIEARTEDD